MPRKPPHAHEIIRRSRAKIGLMDGGIGRYCAHRKGDKSHPADEPAFRLSEHVPPRQSGHAFVGCRAASGEFRLTRNGNESGCKPAEQPEQALYDQRQLFVETVNHLGFPAEPNLLPLNEFSRANGSAAAPGSGIDAQRCVQVLVRKFPKGGCVRSVGGWTAPDPVLETQVHGIKVKPATQNGRAPIGEIQRIPATAAPEQPFRQPRRSTIDYAD